jgi:hypothetical protein
MATGTGTANIQGLFYSNATGIPTFTIATGYVLIANGDNTASWSINTASSSGGSTFSGVMSGIASGLQFYGENTAIINQTVATGTLNLQVGGAIYESIGVTGGISIYGQTSQQPFANVGTPITTAVVNNQVFQTKIGSGGFTGLIATIPLYGASGTSPSPATGVTELDVQTSMMSLLTMDAARFKYSWQIVGVGTALATPMGPVAMMLSAGTNGVPTAAACPSGWNATLQLDANKNNVIAYVSIPSGTVDVKSQIMWGFTR